MRCSGHGDGQMIYIRPCSTIPSRLFKRISFVLQLKCALEKVWIMTSICNEEKLTKKNYKKIVNCESEQKVNEMKMDATHAYILIWHSVADICRQYSRMQCEKRQELIMVSTNR